MGWVGIFSGTAHSQKQKEMGQFYGKVEGSGRQLFFGILVQVLGCSCIDLGHSRGLNGLMMGVGTQEKHLQISDLWKPANLIMSDCI